MAGADPTAARDKATPDSTPPAAENALRYTHIRGDATLTPQDSPEKLLRWWKARIPEEFYRMYKVRIVSWEPKDPTNADPSTLLLTFDLVGGKPSAPPKKGLQVYFYSEPEMVWPELPTTAQFAQPNQCAYLLLTATFMKNRAHALPADYAEPGGKWPIGAGNKLLGGAGPEPKAQARVLRAVASLLNALADPPGADDDEE